MAKKLPLVNLTRCPTCATRVRFDDETDPDEAIVYNCLTACPRKQDRWVNDPACFVLREDRRGTIKRLRKKKRAEDEQDEKENA